MSGRVISDRLRVRILYFSRLTIRLSIGLVFNLTALSATLIAKLQSIVDD